MKQSLHEALYCGKYIFEVLSSNFIPALGESQRPQFDTLLFHTELVQKAMAPLKRKEIKNIDFVNHILTKLSRFSGDCRTSLLCQRKHENVGENILAIIPYFSPPLLLISSSLFSSKKQKSLIYFSLFSAKQLNTLICTSFFRYCLFLPPPVISVIGLNIYSWKTCNLCLCKIRSMEIHIFPNKIFHDIQGIL